MRLLLITVTVIIAALSGICFAFVERVDNGVILNIAEHSYDPVGEVDELGNALVRDCSGISKVSPASTEADAIKAYLRASTQAGEPELHLLIKSGKWLIVESTFQNAEPGVFLLQELEHEYAIQSVWGGVTEPFKSAPMIRAYFRENVPTVPVSLIKCYDPVTPPFGPDTGS